ncbi:hypothetical protein ACWGNE_09355 [Streptomyces xiamenensis]
MELDLQHAVQRRMRILVVVLCAVVAVLTGVIIGVLATGGGSENTSGAGTGQEWQAPQDEDTDTAEPSPGFQPPKQVDPPASYTHPDEWVRLPAGTGEENGLPVSFPQSPEGAVAMAAASTRNAWSWDPARVEAGLVTYMSEDEQGIDVSEASELADLAAREMRVYTGLPETGDIPDDATLLGWPIGVRWEEIDADTVRVYMLVRVTFTPGDGAQTQTHLHSTVNDVVWEHGDWKGRSVTPEVAQSGPEVAEIGSVEFNEAGWIAIQEGPTR